MKPLNPKQALNKAFLKVKPNRSEIETFKANLIKLIDTSAQNVEQHEEFHKNLVSGFLNRTYYEGRHFINTHNRQDLVIHNDKTAKSTVGVIIETKKLGNKTEMLRKDKLNVKALQEVLLYFLRERITHKNLEIKYLVVTNVQEWFIFDAQLFEKLFVQNKALVKKFEAFEGGSLGGTKTEFFYKEIAEPYIQEVLESLVFTYLDLSSYSKALRNEDKKDDRKLIALYKLFSPEHLLKLPFANDSNSLDKKFYSELLHIIGLEETKDGGKKVIGRKKAGDRNTGSLLENAIIQLDSLDKLSRLDNRSQYGNSTEEVLFTVGLELAITWVNRILFLKLLEAQLIAYHKGNKDYAFLNFDKIKNYDDLNTLFFQVLAKKHAERNEDVVLPFKHVPYLNSSLFEPNEIEHKTLFISNLRDSKTLDVLPATVLKDGKGKKQKGTLNALQYLFEFLEAYDFSSEGSEDIQEENKTLINASVLGLIFEKINGYKDGSFFTPGFITMYMCRETIQRAVLQKFKEAKGWECETIAELEDRLELKDRQEANDIINSLKICDPAVGSGHFLVSALNEIIAIKNDLRVLQDRNGSRLKEYQFEVVNDELIITDGEELFEYHYSNKESQRVQEAIFHEKQTIIENCLFGVDINPNSVKICRLRLWIELLKNAYYKNESELETLPNIDINIKCGNSLISRFGLDADIKQALKQSKWTIDSYRLAVDAYRNAQSKEQKHEMERLINDIKNDFRSEISKNDPKVKRLFKINGEFTRLSTQQSLFDMPAKEKKAWNKNLDKLSKELKKLEKEIEEIKSNKIYENAFEWRFEFPEVLNDNGDFVGFDGVIGNPPYFSLSKIKDEAAFLGKAGYETYLKGTDIYVLFFELGSSILKDFGCLTYITSNSWLRAQYGEPLKAFFASKMQPRLLLNIEDIQVFEEATVESSILLIQKEKTTSNFNVCNLESDYDFGSSLEKYFVENSYQFIPPESSLWLIERPEILALKASIEASAKPLKDFDVRINFGVKTGYNAAFIIDKETKENLISNDLTSSEIIKPILRGRDLSKYSFDFDEKWIISTFPSLEVDIEKYKGVKEYFYKIGKKRLEQTGNVGSRKKTFNEWFETQDTIGYWEDFEKPKIVWGEISDKPKFGYDEEGYYAEATTFLMTGEKLKFLLGILNSKVSEWYFNLIGTTTGMGTNRWKKYKIELLPIPVVTEENENLLESKVNQILSLKKENPIADTAALEAEIDQLVYTLYDLTREEIAIVEGN